MGNSKRDQELSCRRLGHCMHTCSVDQCYATTLHFPFNQSPEWDNFAVHRERRFDAEGFRSRHIEKYCCTGWTAMDCASPLLSTNKSSMFLLFGPQLLRWVARLSCIKSRWQDLQSHEPHMEVFGGAYMFHARISDLACTPSAILPNPGRKMANHCAT